MDYKEIESIISDRKLAGLVYAFGDTVGNVKDEDIDNYTACFVNAALECGYTPDELRYVFSKLKGRSQEERNG